MAEPAPPPGLDPHRLTLAAGDYLYRAGDPAPDMFVIRQGEIEVLRDVAGAASRVATLAAGDVVGELAMLEGGARDSSARALTPCDLVRVDAATLVALVQRRPEIAVQMLRRLARRLSENLDAREAAAASREPAVTRSRSTRATRAMPAAQAAGKTPGKTVAAVVQVQARLVDARPGSTTSYTLGQTTTIGRTLRNTIVIPAPDVSRSHARIDLTPGGFVLSDLGSQNGTFVNGERIKERVLQDDDQVRIGDEAWFVFVVGGGHEDQPVE